MPNPMSHFPFGAAKPETPPQPRPNRAQRRARDQHLARERRRGQRAYDRGAKARAQA